MVLSRIPGVEPSRRLPTSNDRHEVPVTRLERRNGQPVVAPQPSGELHGESPAAARDQPASIGEHHASTGPQPSSISEHPAPPGSQPASFGFQPAAAGPPPSSLGEHPPPPSSQPASSDHQPAPVPAPKTTSFWLKFVSHEKRSRAYGLVSTSKDFPQGVETLEAMELSKLRALIKNM